MSTVALVGGRGRYQNITRALSLVVEEFTADFSKAIRPIIKVNFVSDSVQLAATHVDAVRAVLDLLSPQTTRTILIAEASYGNTQKGFSNFGYRELEKEYDHVELRDLNDDETEDRSGFKLSKTLLGSDFRVSIGPPKTHETTIFTGAMKNIAVGAIIANGVLGRHWRGSFHRGSYREVNRRLVQLFGYVRPQLAVVDGFRAMEGNGPGHGDPVETNWALVGTNAVEVDAVAAHLLGFNPADIGYLYFARAEGLGEIDLEQINIVGDPPERWRKQIRPHPNYEKELDWKKVYPEVGGIL